MARIFPRKKTTRATRREGLQKLHIKVTSPRIVMFQIRSGILKGMKFVVILAMLALIGFGGYKGIQHLFLGNEKYRLQEIDLQTNGHLTHARVVDVAHIDLNGNIFTIDTHHVRDSLQALPEVTRCKVERRLPGTLKIHITERVPVVWIKCPPLGFPGRSNNGVLADEKGVTFPCEGTLWDSSRDLPVVVVPVAKSDNFNHGHKSTHPDVIRALNLIKTFNTANVRAEWMPERLILVNNYSIKVICNDGSHATFGMHDHDRQVADFITIHEHTLRTHRKITHINLIPHKNIPVVFADDPVLVRPKHKPAPVSPRDRELQSILDRN